MFIASLKTVEDRTNRVSILVHWLAVASFAPALGILVVGLLPYDWLVGLAQRVGHADDVTAERVVRLRAMGVILAAAHLLLSAALLTVWRRATEGLLLAIQKGFCSAPIHPAASIRRALQWAVEPGPIHAISLVLVLLVGAGIRLRYLNIPMDYDEAYSFLNFARRPLYQGLADYHSTNNHLLNTLGMHLGYLAFGQREWALRLHVFVAGVALIAGVYRLGRALAGPDVGLAAAALAATSTVLVNYSVNARGYIWVAWMSVWLVRASWSLAGTGRFTEDNDHSPATVDWVGAWAAALLGILALPTMIYSIAGCAGWLMIESVRQGGPVRPRMVSLVVWSFLVGLGTTWLYAPALVFRGLEAWRHRFVSAQLLEDWLVRVLPAWWLAVTSSLEGAGTLVVRLVILALGSAVLCICHRRLLALLASVPIATCLIMALQRVTPPPRVFSFLSPLLLLIAGAGAVALLRSRTQGTEPVLGQTRLTLTGLASFLLTTVLCVWGVWDAQRNPLPGGPRPIFLVQDVGRIGSASARTSPGENQLWRLSSKAAVAELAPEMRPGDRVLVALPVDLPFHFYAAQRGLSLAIGGQPQPGERLFLVVRPCDSPHDALQHNPSLLFTESWVLDAEWQPWRRLEQLTIYQAQTARGTKSLSHNVL